MTKKPPPFINISFQLEYLSREAAKLGIWVQPAQCNQACNLCFWGGSWDLGLQKSLVFVILSRGARVLKNELKGAGTKNEISCLPF